MDDKKNRENQDNPEKAFLEELRQEGNTFKDTPIESDARDRAKMIRTSQPDSQKLDGNNPYADEDSVSDEDINKEYYDDHK